jgi:hypothetical protein
MKDSYLMKLKSPKWQKKRLEILNLRNFKCEICGNEERELHVHHRFYLKGRQPWQYDNDVFQVLCSNCHENHHSESKESIKEVIPKKYEKLFLFIESIDFFDIDNLIFILDQDNNNHDINETFRLLSNALNSGWLDSALDVIRNKEQIENLEIGLSVLQEKFDELNSKLK